MLKTFIFFILIFLPLTGRAAQYIYSFQDASTNASLGTLTIDTSTLTPNTPAVVNSSIFKNINLHQGIYTYNTFVSGLLTIDNSNQMVTFTDLNFKDTFYNSTIDLNINTYSDGMIYNTYTCCGSPDTRLFTISDPVMVVPEPASLCILLGTAAFTSLMKRRRLDSKL